MEGENGEKEREKERGKEKEESWDAHKQENSAFDKTSLC